MAMIQCPKCGSKIANMVLTCPYCGFDLSKLDPQTLKKPKLTPERREVWIGSGVFGAGLCAFVFSPFVFKFPLGILGMLAGVVIACVGLHKAFSAQPKPYQPIQTRAETPAKVPTYTAKTYHPMEAQPTAQTVAQAETQKAAQSAVSYSNSKKQSTMMTFGKWGDVHETPDQQKRITRAQDAACTPLSVSAETQSGTFSGSRGVYTTTLENCTCMDFNRRHLPCKHIYRLAMELGLVEGTVVSDISKVKRQTPLGLSLRDAVEVIEGVGDRERRALHEILYKLFYKNKMKSTQIALMLTPEIENLLKAGILEPAENLRMQLDTFRLHELRKYLTDAGITGFDKTMRRDPFIDWICENVPDAADVFWSAVVVRIADPFVKTSRKIYTYLNRRDETDQIFREDDGSFETVPKGAQYTIKALPDGSTEHVLAFPDDEITLLLDKYGHNRCDGWEQ